MREGRVHVAHSTISSARSAPASFSASRIATRSAGDAPIAYPEGFRAWTHVSSGVVGPKSPAAPKYEGVHHIYANATALEGYRTGRWADGAVIVYDQWTAVAAPADSTVAGERNRSSVADARHNLADLDAKVVATTIEHLRSPRSDLVVADPSRAGLGRAAVHVLASAGAARLVLVSCDPASAGRDAALLTGVGYEPVESVLVDLFPHTHHTEVVTRFDRV